MKQKTSVIFDKLDLQVDFSEDNGHILEEVDMDAVEFIRYASSILKDNFDGHPSQLQSFLEALKLISDTMGNNQNTAVHFIKTRLTGKARVVITNENTVAQIREKLFRISGWKVLNTMNSVFVPSNKARGQLQST